MGKGSSDEQCTASQRYTLTFPLPDPVDPGNRPSWERCRMTMQRGLSGIEVSGYARVRVVGFSGGGKAVGNVVLRTETR